VLAWFDAQPDTAAEALALLDRKLAHWLEHGFGIWMFRNGAGAFVGRYGIAYPTLGGASTTLHPRFTLPGKSARVCVDFVPTLSADLLERLQQRLTESDPVNRR
jgi:hypothetical protein